MRKNDVWGILKEAEDLSCPCYELKRVCLDILERIYYCHNSEDASDN